MLPKAKLLIVLAIAMLSVTLMARGTAFGATTNTAQLDNGMCVQNLQIGSDRTASTSGGTGVGPGVSR